MGSLPKKSKLSDAEIIQRYTDGGESAGLIALRCRVPTYHVMAVLASAPGVRLRGAAEGIRLAMRGAQRFDSMRRMQQRRSAG